jgi:dienelactone hydrolase
MDARFLKRTSPMNVSHARPPFSVQAAPPLVHAPQYPARAAVLLALAGVLVAAPATAQQQGSVSVAIDGTALKLNTVTYKPTGDGPFPTLIFHHGSGKFEHPYDPRTIAQWFVARGWAVIAPSRRGRGGSQGLDEEGAACDEASASVGADEALHDIEVVTPALIAQPFVDRGRLAVGGQSRGGILSVAWSGKHREVRAVINFVGGWMDTRLCRQGLAINQNLLNRGVTWGQPSIWLYGDRDLFYPLKDTKAEFDAFLAAGGKGVWHDYEPPEAGSLNGHQINQVPQLWAADMEAYLAQRDLPSKHAN